MIDTCWEEPVEALKVEFLCLTLNVQNQQMVDIVYHLRVIEKFLCASVNFGQATARLSP
jgi:hypothetical protein